MTEPSPATGVFEERVAVPAIVWAVVLVLDATFALALGVALGGLVGWGVMAVTGGLTAVGLRAAGGRVRVADHHLQAGPASLPLVAAGAVTPLDAEQARRLRGVDADPRAYLWLKGWVPTAVRVEVVDEHDPTPYWYVSTRRPAALAEAIQRARAADGG